MAIADRIVVMNAGRIEDEGPPERVYRRPRTLFAADFMGEMNHIPARATAEGVETPFGRLPAGATRPGPAVLCLRPEAIGSGAGAIRIGPATVRDAAFFGTHCRAHVVPEAAPELVLVAHLPPGRLPAPGETLMLAAEAETASVFPAEA